MRCGVARLRTSPRTRVRGYEGMQGDRAHLDSTRTLTPALSHGVPRERGSEQHVDHAEGADQEADDSVDCEERHPHLRQIIRAHDCVLNDEQHRRARNTHEVERG